MTPKQYDRLIKAHRLRGAKTIAACRAVLVEKLTAYSAAQTVGVAESVLSRALARLRRSLCPHCGQPMLRR